MRINQKVVIGLSRVGQTLINQTEGCNEQFPGFCRISGGIATWHSFESYTWNLLSLTRIQSNVVCSGCIWPGGRGGDNVRPCSLLTLHNVMSPPTWLTAGWTSRHCVHCVEAGAWLRAEGQSQSHHTHRALLCYTAAGGQEEDTTDTTDRQIVNISEVSQHSQCEAGGQAASTSHSWTVTLLPSSAAAGFSLLLKSRMTNTESGTGVGVVDCITILVISGWSGQGGKLKTFL